MYGLFYASKTKTHIICPILRYPQTTSSDSYLCTHQTISSDS